MSNCPFGLWCTPGWKANFAAASTKAAVGSAATRSGEKDAAVGCHFAFFINAAAVFVNSTWCDFVIIFFERIETT